MLFSGQNTHMSTFGVFKRRKSNTDFGQKAIENMKISKKNLKNIFSDCGDFELRELRVEGKNYLSAQAAWLDGLVNTIGVSEDMVRPFAMNHALAECKTQREMLEKIMSGQIYAAAARHRTGMQELVTDMLMGFVVLIFEDLGEAVSFDLRSLQSRAISEPSVEKTVKGAKGAFVETMRINTSLVRRHLRTSRLKLRQTVVGRKSGTNVAVMFVEDVAKPETVEEIMSRLEAISIDGLLAAGNLEQYICDNPRSPFPQLIHTERPDKFAADLLEGRVGLIVDGLPLGFLLPAPLPAFMVVGDDRARQFLVASFLRLLRWASLLITATLPALFVAMSMYHQEMIPTQLLMSMIEAKQKVPFASPLEILGLLLAFELLQEAGLRLPNPIGDTVSIIGALIVGQAAVEARVVSPVAVIIVAAAGICSFTLPSQDLAGALRLIRLALVLLAAALGLFGLMLGAALTLWHLCSMESFGLAYTSPLSEGGIRAWLRSLLRPPLWMSRQRPEELAGKDKQNQA